MTKRFLSCDNKPSTHNSFSTLFMKIYPTRRYDNKCIYFVFEPSFGFINIEEPSQFRFHIREKCDVLMSQEEKSETILLLIFISLYETISIFEIFFILS